MEKFDLVVIGGGPGGYPAAIRAAQLGARVVLIEKEALGGTCLNWGCIPTKAMIASAELFWRQRQAIEMGVKPTEAGCDYSAISSRKDVIVEKLRGGIAQLLKAHKVTVVRGKASFLGRHRIAADVEHERIQVETKTTIVATGSESVLPAFLPASPRIMDSRAFLGLRELPPRLIVLGGGVIGCEFACMAARLGTQVTVVELLDDILMILDADVRRELRRHMEQILGIKIMAGARLENVVVNGGITAEAGGVSLKADALLVAVGRRPATSDLALETAGLGLGPSGQIETDEACRTKTPTVYAVGDVTGKSQLAHAATAQGLVAAENAVSGKTRKAETLVPVCIFTSPEIGSVGLSENQAVRLGRKVKIGKFSFSSLGKALALGETHGFVKLIADAETDQLLGAQVVGPHATELISEATVAIRSELTALELANTIHCHPTLAEAWMEAAHAVHGQCVHAPPPRR